MPAITVPDLLALDRIPTPDPAAAVERPVARIGNAAPGFEGEGFPVNRAFAGLNHRDISPFLMMDQMGEVEYAPGEPKGTPWHPRTAASRPSPTSSTASSTTRTPTAAAAPSPTATPSG